MSKNTKAAAGKGKVMSVPLNEDELRRILAQKPKHVRSEAAFVRELIDEALTMREQPKQTNGATA